MMTTPNDLAAAIRIGHGGRPCNCPGIYSRCRYAVRWSEEHGDYSQGHGGWGWAHPENAPAPLDPSVCVGGVCAGIDHLCSRHQAEYQRKYGRASNE